jgi:hypothetical protein
MLKTLGNVRTSFAENHPIVAISVCVAFVMVLGCIAGAYLA